MKQALGRVVVLLGGRSAEREISLLSGRAVLEALQRSGVHAEAFDPAERDLSELAAGGYDRAFIALHGRGGEDGTVQGLLECLRLPYTGSGVMASALAMDKWRTKQIWQAAGLPTPAARVIRQGDSLEGLVEALGLPLFVKPVHEGSSMGASKVSCAEALAGAVADALEYDSQVLVEAFVSGQELTCPFLGPEALPVVRIVPPPAGYDYQNKYFTEDTKYHCPSGLPSAVEAAVQQLALTAAAALGCRGWGRADFLLTDAGEPVLLEMNTAPGMTGHSLVPMSARAVGIGFDDLVCRILAMAALAE